jgi:hypothetical protein
MRLMVEQDLWTGDQGSENHSPRRQGKSGRRYPFAQSPVPVEGIAQGEMQISQVVSKDLSISELLEAPPAPERLQTMDKSRGRMRSWQTSVSLKRKHCLRMMFKLAR